MINTKQSHRFTDGAPPSYETRTPPLCSPHPTPLLPRRPLALPAATSKLVHVSSVDFVILSLFAFDPIREDMSRRGWWDERAGAQNDAKRLAAFSAVPLLGPVTYLLLRPPLPEE